MAYRSIYELPPEEREKRRAKQRERYRKYHQQRLDYQRHWRADNAYAVREAAAAYRAFWRALRGAADAN